MGTGAIRVAGTESNHLKEHEHDESVFPGTDAHVG